MLRENDVLKEEIIQLKTALANADEQNENAEIKRLRIQVSSLIEERNQAAKQALLCRQLTLHYKQRDEFGDQALVDQIWVLEMKL